MASGAPLKRLRQALLSALPAGFAALMVLGLMGIVGIRLVASPLVPVREFGWLICLSMLASAATAPTLLPGFLGSDRAAARGDSASVAAEQLGSGGLVLPHLEVVERGGSDG